MLVEVDWDAIVAERAKGGLVRVRPDCAARIWRDAGAASFAATIGFQCGEGPFRILAGISERDPEAPATAFYESADSFDAQPVDTPHGPFQPIGIIFDNLVFADPADGSVWISDIDCDTEYEKMHQDVSSFAYVLYLLKAERPKDEADPDGLDWSEAIDSIRQKITRWDATPFAEADGFWERYLDSYPMY